MQVIRRGQTAPADPARDRAIRWKERANNGVLAIETALLENLRQLARDRQPMPNNTYFAARWNRCAASICDVFARLERRGKIRRHPARVIEIVETGERTAPRSWKLNRSDHQERVYRMLAEAASAGRTTPSVSDIARQIEISPSTACATLQSLARRGELRLHGLSRQPGFSVEIVATGERTKPTLARAYKSQAATLRQTVAELAARVEALEQVLGKGGHGR